MSRADLNKLAGAVLVTLLVTLLISNVINEFFRAEPLERNVYVVAGAEAPEQPPAAAPEEPEVERVAPLLAAADPAAGGKAARTCVACHTFEQGGANKLGPNLWNVVGRDKAALPDFGYSAALREAEGDWTYEDLNAFLADPKGFIEGTRMNYAGVKSVEDRADIIAFLRQQSDGPPPLPEP